jgi:deoxycytidylate deaminase
VKKKHVQLRIEQCLVLAKASHCPRRKLAAMLIDPQRNVVLADGYNGGPRGAEGKLCRGYFCERDGFDPEQARIERGGRHQYRRVGGSDIIPEMQVHYGETKRIQAFDKPALGKLEEDTEFGPFDFPEEPTDGPLGALTGHVPAKVIPSAKTNAEEWVAEMASKYPPIKSGTRMERGCHHAEMNVICNAAAGGINCSGAWLIVLAEPCMMCAKMIHHAGIAKVILVDGGYAGGKDGVEYLKDNGVKVEEVEGPKDPRTDV